MHQLWNAFITDKYKNSLSALPYPFNGRSATGHADAVFAGCHSGSTISTDGANVGTDLSTYAFTHATGYANTGTWLLFRIAARL
jgi:hypothetical protein